MTWFSRLSALLERPWAYALAGRALAPGARLALRARIATELATAPAGRALDVGCGPRSWLARAGVSPIGVDSSPAYARALSRSGGIAVVARAEALPFPSGSFASVWCFGLLHHLSDDKARGALAEAGRVARPGRRVVFDAVLPGRGRRPLAWALRRLDRGGFMRGETALRTLLAGLHTDLQAAGPAQEQERNRNRPADWRVTRFTYSWTGLEGLWCALG